MLSNVNRTKFHNYGTFPKFNTNENNYAIIPQKELREVNAFGGRI